MSTIAPAAVEPLAQVPSMPAPAALAPELPTPAAPPATQNIAPPSEEIKLPTPPVHAVAPDTSVVASPETHAANKSRAEEIEALLQPFISDRIPEAYRTGVSIEVKLAPCNAITAEGGEADSHDISISFKGGALEDKHEAKILARMLRAALREHPAFTDLGFSGEDGEIELVMRCQILQIEPKRLESLLKPQPRIQRSFLSGPIKLKVHDTVKPIPPEPAAAPAAPAPAHSCTGAGCQHCGPTPAHTAHPETAANDAAKPAEPAPTSKPAEVIASTTPPAPLPATTEALAGNMPTVQVQAPVAHLGHAAANDPHVKLTA